jgi:hypothetical protein
MTTVILLHKAPNSSAGYDQHTMATVITTHAFININTQNPKSLNNSK